MPPVSAPWSPRPSGNGGGTPTGPLSFRDPDTYLRALEDDTRRIRITGLTTKRAEPYFFGTDEIYIPLTTLASHEGVGGADT